jgi:microcystin-dependent protein
MFAGNFAPIGHALCDGQLVAITQNEALFSLLGTIYGGDGRTTFGLPDMRGRLPLHAGTGPGLTPRTIGQRAGAEAVTMNVSSVAEHSHGIVATTEFGSDNAPANNLPAATAGENLYNATAEPDVFMSGATISPAPAGGGQPIANVMPFQCINFIIALVGIYPSRP